MLGSLPDKNLADSSTPDYTRKACQRGSSLSRCPICNKDAPEGSRFCPFCGAKLLTQAVRKTDPLLGKVLAGKYKVLERIGSGAMGSIYRAEHTALSKPVVIKVLHRHLVADESHIRRFHREAKAASRLNQPNCINVLDFGQSEDGWLYICMEYVAGKDLCRILFEEKRLDAERTVRIASQVLDALDEAHNQGVIHRDLKPENIMIERLRMNPDFVKVLDFGIAKIRDTDGQGDSSGFKTATGMVFGTPEYMSPEQVRGEELDGRSDLYSLGIVMYQMLSGELPFTGESVLEIATKHLTEPPVPLHERCPDVPKALCDFVHRLLEKRRERRYATAAEAKAALLASLSGVGASRVRPGESREKGAADGASGLEPRAGGRPVSRGEAVRSSAPHAPVDASAYPPISASPRSEEADRKESSHEITTPGRSKTMRNLALVVLVLLGAAAVTLLGVTLLHY